MHLDLISLLQTFGYLGIAAIVFAESGLFFGFFLPGDSLLFTAGFLASQGFFNIFALMFLACVFAILGDSTGYWFGTKVGPMIFTRTHSFWFNKKRIEQAERFFEKHGAKSLILARFIPAVRTFTPIMAGVGKMKYPSFLLYNFLGAVLWGILTPLLGFWLGSAVPNPDRYILPIVFLIIILSALPVAIELVKNKIKK
jgi:membrane-associated protein